MTFHSLPVDSLRDITTEYLIGAETTLWTKWEAEITPGFDKFYFLLEGDFYFEIDGTPYHGHPGQLFFLPRNTSQRYHAYNNPNARKIWFHALYNCDDHPLTDILALPHFVTIQDIPSVYTLFKTLVDIDGNTPASYVRRKSAMLEVLACYLEACDTLSVKLVADNRLTEISAYIDTHFRDHLTISELAHKFGYSESYFIRYFKKNMGITPANYIIERRLALAKELLQSTNLSIGEIALQCGFDKDANYFSRIFKSRTGFVPTVYRTNSKIYNKDFVMSQKQEDANLAKKQNSKPF